MVAVLGVLTYFATQALIDAITKKNYIKAETAMLVSLTKDIPGSRLLSYPAAYSCHTNDQGVMPQDKRCYVAGGAVYTSTSSKEKEKIQYLSQMDTWLTLDLPDSTDLVCSFGVSSTSIHYTAKPKVGGLEGLKKICGTKDIGGYVLSYTKDSIYVSIEIGVASSIRITTTSPDITRAGSSVSNTHR